MIWGPLLVGGKSDKFFFESELGLLPKSPEIVAKIHRNFQFWGYPGLGPFAKTPTPQTRSWIRQ